MQLAEILKTYRVTIAALFLTAVISGVTFRYEPVLAAIETACMLLVLFYGFYRMNHGFDRLRERIYTVNRSLSFGEESEEDRLVCFPLAFALCDADGKIVWFNSLFEESIVKGCGFTYTDMNECLRFQGITESPDFTPLETDIHGRYFTVYPSRLEESLYALYFTEDTELKNFRRAYLLSRPAVLLINVDSLENTEDTYSHIDFSTINADIDRMISTWLASNGCVFRKYSDGRYFALTEFENLDKMTEKRFTLLDEIRAYRYEGKDPDITLSVGIGREPTYRECEISARFALDMARGRGGDQVAIKVGENFDFFGGISSKKEKRGKVKSRSVAAALSELIEKAPNVLLMGHVFSDFDSIGAAVGVAAICSSLGVRANIVVNRSTTLSLPLIENCEKSGNTGLFVSPERGLVLLTEDTLLVVTDTLRPALADTRPLLDRARSVVVIDHHRMAVDHIENPTLLFHEPYASSASEMVTELIQYSPSKPVLTQTQAEALLAGIILDTKNFTLRVGVRTFEAAAFLRERKPDTVRVKKLFSATAAENLLVNKIVSSAKFYDGYAVAYTELQDPAMRLLCSKAADELLNIRDVDSSYVVSQQGDTVMISARSLGAVNVQLIMEKLGGGGHQSMAAAQLKDVSAQDALKLLSLAIQEYYSSNKIRIKEDRI